MNRVGLAFVADFQVPKPEDCQEIHASAGLLKLPEFMTLIYTTDGPESLLAIHLAGIARAAFEN